MPSLRLSFSLMQSDSSQLFLYPPSENKNRNYWFPPILLLFGNNYCDCVTSDKWLVCGFQSLYCDNTNILPTQISDEWLKGNSTQTLIFA
ncbi:hypothetical protein XELAEV_18002973mg [Xenopus laevis]|uniref:Uncharacterized protein n=1 Tax=Xenopus laevis TaxID=8355 RepID=A0A974GYJ9_XENLA|nr:hypothetical protein XELAEV_18002973mg [Xenopus laevis]